MGRSTVKRKIRWHRAVRRDDPSRRGTPWDVCPGNQRLTSQSTPLEQSSQCHLIFRRSRGVKGRNRESQKSGQPLSD